MRRHVLIVGLVIVALFALALYVRPYILQEIRMDSDHFEFVSDYSLDGELDDSLVVLAQTTNLGSESHVTGDAAILGGTVMVNGHIDGDLILIGETLELGESGSVGGDLYVFGGTAQVNGQVAGNVEADGETLMVGERANFGGVVISCSNDLTDGRADASPVLPCQNEPFGVSPDPFTDPFSVPEGAGGGTVLALSILSSLATSLLLCGLAALAVTLFPRQISHIEEALRIRTRNQVLTGIMVFLAMIAVGAATVVLLASVPVLGLLLLPIFLVLCLLFFGMVLAGMSTVSIVFGGWLLKRVSRAEWPPLVQAAVGSVMLSLLLHLPAFLPFGEFLTLLAVAALSIIAVGASLTTRMGTRSLTQRLSV